MTNSAVSNITSNVNVGINEVVSVFVSKYENNLFSKKDDISSNIKTLKTELADQDKRLINSIDKVQYELSIEALNIHSTVEDVKVLWEDKKGAKINVNVKVSDKDNKSSYGSYLTKTIEVAVDQSEIASHKERSERLVSLNNELVEILALIKGVSRKERQIRGQISEMKLKESGFEQLLENQDILALVQL